MKAKRSVGDAHVEITSSSMIYQKRFSSYQKRFAEQRLIQSNIKISGQRLTNLYCRDSKSNKIVDSVESILINKSLPSSTSLCHSKCSPMADVVGVFIE